MRRRLGLALLMQLACMTPAAVAQCTAGSVTNLVLGPYTGSQLSTGSQPLKVTCSSGAAYAIAIDQGSGVGATTTIRKMTLNGITLNYQIFKDSALTLNWGNTTSDDLNGTGSGASQSLFMYPVILAGQNAPSGTYTDTVNASAKYGINSIYALPFTVTATVSTACSMSVGNLNFGVYAGAQKDVTAAIAVTCTNATHYYVNLNNGTNSICCWFERMTGPGGQLLTYANYTNSTRTSQWGNTYNSDGVAGIGNGSAQTLTVYSRLFAGPLVTPGVYSDTIIATITY